MHTTAIDFIFCVIVYVIIFLCIMYKRRDMNQSGKKNSYSSSQNSRKHQQSIEDRDYYLMACSTVALFSWVIRRDGNIDSREMETARLYFKKNPDLSTFLKHPPLNEKEDPVLGIERPAFTNCMDLLEYYNQCTNLLRYDLCCDNIIRIYPSNMAFSHKRNYESISELMKALYQVAFSSDGVIGSELEILHEIAKHLQIPEYEWHNLEEMFGQYQAGGKKSKRNRNKREKQKGDSTQQGGSGSEKQEQTKKSSTFGYKLTQAYNQLGILTTATETEIKSTYRKLVKKYHPDRLSPDATDLDRKISADQFRQIKEAYDLIRMEKGM